MRIKMSETLRDEIRFGEQFLGASLGLVAGILFYTMIAGEILAGAAFPDISKGHVQYAARSIFWGIASGFSFEWVFDRIRSVTAGEN